MKNFRWLFLSLLLLLFLFLRADRAGGLSVDQILRANDAASLKRRAETEKKQEFLSRLCDKKNLPEAKKSRPLAACYRRLSLQKRLSGRAEGRRGGFARPPSPQKALRQQMADLDSFCLSLTVFDFDRELLGPSLQTKEISPPCRRHLKEKLKILNYRKQDELVPKILF